MNLNAIKCPNCNATIAIESNDQECQCEYCGSRFQVQDGVIHIDIKNRYVDEVRMKQLELQEKHLETRLALLKEEQAKYEKKRREWKLGFIGVLSAIGISMVLGLTIPSFANGMFLMLTGVILLFGGIALYVLRPAEPDNAQNVLSRFNNEFRSAYDSSSAKNSSPREVRETANRNMDAGFQGKNYGNSRMSNQHVQYRSTANISNWRARTFNSNANNYGMRVSGRSKITALLLCIFLGFIGAHHFYCGRYGKGILYLFTGGLFYVGWIYDIFQIASGKYVDADGLYLR